jgi:hypothetical protein
MSERIDTDELIAAIFAGVKCSHPNVKAADFLREYEAFLKIFQERHPEPDIAGYAAVAAKAFS